MALAVTVALWGPLAFAGPPLPTGGEITSGTGAIAQSGNTLTVNQSSQNLAANWQSFDVGADHAVVFNQPNSTSVALNRVIGSDASSVYGSLTANGHVFLVNPNGVLFAPGSQVSVGGLVVSTLAISDADFAAGRYRFTDGSDAGSVVNEGSIEAGSVALLGPQVINRGTISTPGGNTTLAAGDRVTVSMLGGLLSAEVDASVLNAEIQNQGQITADGGRVGLLAGRADSVLDSLVNTDGVIQANSLREENGKIYLDGGAGGTVTVSGTVDASGAEAGAHGGDVTLLGKHVGLMEGAQVDASGDIGGGTVLIGGNWQGKGPEHNAEATYMDTDATVRADATGHGDGGTVVLWSDDYTGFYGNISARGGASGGDGGQVETSSLGNLQSFGQADAAAPHGAAGQWLLDPYDVTIGTADNNTGEAGGVFTPTGSPATIDVATINTALDAGTAVTVNTGAGGTEAGDITVASAIAKTAGADTSLTLDAAGSIVVNADITSSVGLLDVNLNANGGAISGTGNFNTNGGLLTVHAASGTGTLSGLISGTGSLTKQGAGTLTLSNQNTYSGGTIIDAGTLIGRRGGGANTTITPFGSAAIVIAAGATAVVDNTPGFDYNIFDNEFTGAGTISYLGSSGNRLISGASLSAFTGVASIDQNIVQLYGADTTATLNVNSGATFAVWDVSGFGNPIFGALTGNGSVAGVSGGGGGTLTIGNGGGSGTFSGVISNNFPISLVKIGNGIQTLSGNNVSYTGTTTVNGGTLSLSNVSAYRSATTVNGGATLELAGNSNINYATGFSLALNDGSTLSKTNTGYSAFDQGQSVTIDGTVAIDITNDGVDNQLVIDNTPTGLTGSGTINLTNTGSATTGLTLRRGPGSFSGAINVAGGSLNIGLVAGSSAGNVLQNTNLNLTGGARLNLAGAFAATATNASVKSLTGDPTATVALGAQTLTLGTNDGTGADFAGVISGTGALVKTGAGTQTLTGDNTYTGTTAISGGTLQVGNGGSSGTLGTGAVTDDASLIFDRADTHTVANAIGGTGSVTQAGSGTTIFTGNNSYSGTTAVDAGVLQIGDGGTTGTLGTGAATIDAGGTLEFFRSDVYTVANDLSGTGLLSLRGTGVSNESFYAPSGSNTGFTGTVSIADARLFYDNANDLGAAATIDVLSGGQIYVAADIANAMSLNGTGWLESAGSLGALRLGDAVTASGAIELQSDSRIMAQSVGANAGTISGVISGTGALETGGNDATLILSGANTFSGPLHIRHGVHASAVPSVILAPTGSLAATEVIIGDASSATSSGNYAVLQHEADDQMPDAVVTLDAAWFRWAYMRLLGTSQSVLGIVDSSGAGVVENTETQTGVGDGTLTLTGDGSYSFNGFLRNIFPDSDTLALVKNGAGTQTLSGDRINYTGDTTVNDGTLLLSLGTVADGGYNSATTVNSGATLELAQDTPINHAAGFSLVLNDGSTLNKTGGGGNAFDKSDVVINGTVAINVTNGGISNLYIGGLTTGLTGSGTINLTNTGSEFTGLTLLGGQNGFSGTINVSGGVLDLTSSPSDGDLALANTDLDLSASARLNLAGHYFGRPGSDASVMSLTGDSTATVVLGGQTLTLGTNDGTGADFAGVISGAGALVKTGTGTQTLSGDNSYTGTTTISGGTLQVGNGGTSGTLGTGAVTDDASLVFDRSNSHTVANAISGTGSLTQVGSGTTILTGNNTYSGTTTVDAGTLQVGANGASGTLGTGAVTNDAELVFNRSDTVSLSELAAGGIIGTGNVAALIGGGLTVGRDIALSGANSTILLEAGKDVAAGDASGGDVILSSNVSTSAGGTITIFSGNADTAAHEAQVSGADGATRYKTYNAAASDTSGTTIGTRNYYYRQQPGTLTVSGLTASKEYDGLLDAMGWLDASVATIGGAIDGDAIAFGDLTVTDARFDSAHAGPRTLNVSFSGLTLSSTGGGADWSTTGYAVGNYSDAMAGTITPKTMTVAINAVDKTYDGLTGTTSTLTAPSGFIGNDNATGVSGLLLAFDDPNAGTQNVVASGTGSVTGFAGTANGDGSGVGAGNEVAGVAGDYVITASPASAEIHKAPLTVIANDDAKIVTQGDGPGYNGASYSGFVNGEGAADLSGGLSITRGNAGTEAAGDYAGVLAPTGLTSGNYDISYVNGDFKILPAEQLLIRIQNVISVYGTEADYDITSVQYLDGGGATLHALTQTAQDGHTYTYSDGAGGSVTFTVAPDGAVISSAGFLAVGNYDLSGIDASIGGSNFSAMDYVGNQTVTQLGLMPLPGGEVSKVYDGTTSLNGVSMAFSGLLTGDEVLTDASGAFSSKNAGSGLGYTINHIALSGADAGNYYVTAGGFSGSDGVITPRSLTASGITANDRVYDGTTGATLTTSGYALSGLVTGDTVGLDAASYNALFGDRNAGTDKTVSVTGLGLSGADAGNYTLTQPAGLTADITPRPLTVTALPNSKDYDGTTSASAIPLVSGELVGGDSFLLFAEEYATANVGTGLTLLPLISIEDGNGGANYAVTLVNDTTGEIRSAVDLSLVGGSHTAANLSNAGNDGQGGDGANGDHGAGSAGGSRRKSDDEFERRVVQVIATGLRLPQGIPASALDNFGRFEADSLQP